MKVFLWGRLALIFPRDPGGRRRRRSAGRVVRLARSPPVFDNIPGRKCCTQVLVILKKKNFSIIITIISSSDHNDWNERREHTQRAFHTLEAGRSTCWLSFHLFHSLCPRVFLRLKERERERPAPFSLSLGKGREKKVKGMKTQIPIRKSSFFFLPPSSSIGSRRSVGQLLPSRGESKRKKKRFGFSFFFFSLYVERV